MNSFSSGAHALGAPVDSKRCGIKANEHVAILMCTYNGEAFLKQQLESFDRQTFGNWSLHVSDDGSFDGTLALLEAYRARWGDRVRNLSGPGCGFARNFLSLTCRLDIAADFYAWSDQDDIWCENKLMTAVEWLRSVPSEQPALYCGRTRITSGQGACGPLSLKFPLAPNFRNALVQSIAGGNTMVFNQAARRLITQAGWKLEVPSHDWWCYQLVTASGGIVHYDPDPQVLYRQHDENVIGCNVGWRSRIQRVRMLLKGRFHDWNSQNIAALEGMKSQMREEHYRTLMLFKAARGQYMPLRMVTMIRAGLYRQTMLGNPGLWFATLIGKI